jgi:hypothetical protein
LPLSSISAVKSDTESHNPKLECWMKWELRHARKVSLLHTHTHTHTRMELWERDKTC